MKPNTASSQADTTSNSTATGTVLPEVSASATTNHDSHAAGHHSGSWLPQTGEDVQRWLAVTGSVLLMITGGIVVWWRKRRA